MQNRIDQWILFTVLGLMAFGLIMVYSSSAFYADKFRHDHLYYLKRQILWVFFGIVLMVSTYKIPYKIFEGKSWLLIFLSVGLLTYLLANGGGRWIHTRLINIQVSDIARLSIIIFLADSLSRKEQYLKNFGEGFMPHLFYILLLAGLIVAQPDFSSAAMLVLIGVLIMFISPIPFRYFALSFIVVAPVAILIVTLTSYQWDRIEAFLHPENDVLGKGYQIIQSLISLGAGGITGVGFAKGSQKLFFLPEAHTDFIFSIIGEEWGLIGTFFVVSLFFILFWRGIYLAHRARDQFSRYLAFGLTMNLVVYALINMMVAAHLVPPTGLPLPFISYGGSSMLISSISAGLLLNISARTCSEVQENSYQFAHRAQRNLENRKLSFVR
ncbi:MAG: putative lipid II flippase FtsW [Candidatus Helarchaeota archaeon]